MKNALFILLFLLAAPKLRSQELFVGDISEYPRDRVSTIVDSTGDTTVHIAMYTCIIVAEKKFSGSREKAKWDKLKRDVKKAYPYAVLARMKLAEWDTQLVYIKGERARKDFIEKCEDELVKQFETDMRQLTFSQGKILIKLLDRETGSTTYQIIKERRGTFSAFMWQSVAFVFGNNLKSEYDAVGDDAKIEEVVQLIEMGVI
ncbi:MAG TPA: DUF4294 domain-containing protein [Bacteroidia bacterium]|nr:DUF4294 domain-containing protein [Bacteroidia bacterium]